MAEGPERGLALVDDIDGLDDYYLLHATRAELLRRLGRPDHDATARAIALAPSEVERGFLATRPARRAPRRAT
jgi:RNA polymerase sigma-70 factor (ECF subfamily)